MLLNAKHKTQLFSVSRLRTKCSGENNTQSTGKANDSAIFTWHRIWIWTFNLEQLEHRPTTSAGKPVSILRSVAEKCGPSFHLGSLFSARWDCFVIFVPTCHESVTVVKKSVLSHCTVFHFVFSWYFGVESLPDKTYCLKNLMFDVSMKEIVNTTLNA